MESVATQVGKIQKIFLLQEHLGKVNAEAEKDHEARRKEIEALLGPMTAIRLEKFSRY